MKELYAKWTKQLNWHLENPRGLKGQGTITAESPAHQEWLQNAFNNLKKNYNLWFQAPTLWISYD